jgi:hypothetical protein
MRIQKASYDTIEAGPDRGRYLIWSNEHRAWWGPDHCGYSVGLQKAGRYTRDQAISISRTSIPTAGHIGLIDAIPVREADLTEMLSGAMVPRPIFYG